MREKTRASLVTRYIVEWIYTFLMTNFMIKKSLKAFFSHNSVNKDHFLIRWIFFKASCPCHNWDFTRKFTMVCWNFFFLFHSEFSQYFFTGNYNLWCDATIKLFRIHPKSWEMFAIFNIFFRFTIRELLNFITDFTRLFKLLLTSLTSSCSSLSLSDNFIFFLLS